MLQFYIPEVVSVEQVFDKQDEITEKEFTKLEEKIMTKTKQNRLKMTSQSECFVVDEQKLRFQIVYNFM